MLALCGRCVFMSEQMQIRHRRPRATPKRSHRIAAVFEQLAPGTAAPALAFPGIAVPEPEGAKRRFVAGSFATLLHAAGVGFLLLLASLAPVIEEELIPVSTRVPRCWGRWAARDTPSTARSTASRAGRR